MPKTRSYTDVLKSLSALAGMTPSRVTVGGDIESTWRALFSNAMRDIWERGNWLEVCPYGEARFAGNKLTYCNDLSNAAWTGSAVTLTRNAAVNPMDWRENATKMFETSADAVHSVEQAVTTLIPGVEYSASIYVRGRGRSTVYLEVNDGDEDHYAFFDLLEGATAGASDSVTATCTQVANGYFHCKITFTTSADADSNGRFYLSLSSSLISALITSSGDTIVTSDGDTLVAAGDSTTSYAGDTTKGAYLWGALLQQTTDTGGEDLTVEFDQDGENEIEAVFDVYGVNPIGMTMPRTLANQLTPQGIQLISTSVPTTYTNGLAQTSTQGAATNPVYLYYRIRCPQWEGETFSASDTYAVDEQVYFLNSASVGNFYKCITATSAGESPDSAPTKWEVIAIDDVFFQAAIYRTYSDWLIADGQMEKAPAATMIADRFADQAFDRLERAMAHQSPFRVSTHLSART
jgi:hypothetical protein